MSASSNISAYLRVGSIAVAGYDYLQTLPFEWRLWREQWRGGRLRLTLSFILFLLIRYTSILVLVVSNTGFFYTQFTTAGCLAYYLTPSVFKVVQTMVSQAILGFRAYNLSRQSRRIGCCLLAIYIISCTLEWVATLYNRQIVYTPSVRNCASSSPSDGLGGWLHYAVAIVYDFTTTVFCIVFLLRLKPSSASVMAKVARMMLVDGVWYFVALAGVNILNLAFYRAKPLAEEIQTAGASLGYCVTWIMSQKLILHLHEASLERRNDSIHASVTVTQQFTAARDVNRAMRSQFESKSGRGLDLTVPEFDIESCPSALGYIQEDVDVQVRIERTVRMETVPQVYGLEDYSRSARSTTRSKHH